MKQPVDCGGMQKMKQNRTCDVYEKLNKMALVTYKNEKNGSCDVNKKLIKRAPMT